MTFISILFLVVFVIISVFLVFMVLAQREGTDSIGAMFGDNSAQQYGRRSGNILTRITTFLGALFMVLAFTLAWLNRSQDTSDIERAVRAQGRENSVEWWLEEEELPSNTDEE